MASEFPEIDRVAGCPHPRETYTLVGHGDAETEIIRALTTGRLPHAWLLSGAPGVGKATLAYRFARYVLENPAFSEKPPLSLDVAPDTKTSRLIESDSHPGLLALKRVWDSGRKKFMTVLSVDEIRKLSDFFGLSATDAGWRVCIVDTADEMNRQAANALLKRLEEPPPRSILILLSNRPGTLLATIKSRCRHLKLSPLNDEDMTEIVRSTGRDLASLNMPRLNALAGGSAGRVLQLLANDGDTLFQQTLSLFAQAPKYSQSDVMSFAEQVAKSQSDITFELAFDFISQILERAASSSADSLASVGLSGDEKAVYTTLAHAYGPELGNVWHDVQTLQRDCLALNLDRKQTIAEIFRRIHS